MRGFVPGRGLTVAATHFTPQAFDDKAWVRAARQARGDPGKTSPCGETPVPCEIVARPHTAQGKATPYRWLVDVVISPCGIRHNVP